MNIIDLNAATFPLPASVSHAQGVQRATGTNAASAVSIANTGSAGAQESPSLRITRGTDQADISSTARTLASIPSLPDPRPDVVSRVRNELASGAYEAGPEFDAKIDAAISEILGEVSAGL